MESVKLESIETKSTASDNSSTKKSTTSSKGSMCSGKTKKGLPCSYKAAKGQTTCKIHTNQEEKEEKKEEKKEVKEEANEEKKEVKEEKEEIKKEGDKKEEVNEVVKEVIEEEKKAEKPVAVPVVAPVIIKEPATLDSKITAFVTWLETNKTPNVVLLREKSVVQWLFGDLSFLPPIEKVNKTKDTEKLKVLEDEWGRKTLKTRRPDLKLDKQWTNMFGEHLCEEIFTLLGNTVTKPTKKDRYCPDREVEDAILEVKAETYFTNGTAGEKILGVPFKYAEVPDLFGKPLKILCLGGAEKECREEYGNLPGPKCSKQKNKFLEFFKENRIEFVGATDILSSMCSK